MRTVISHYRTTAPNANQKLVARTVRVLATGLFAGYVKHHEITLYRKWNASIKLTYCQAAANINNTGHLVQGDTSDLG